MIRFYLIPITGTGSSRLDPRRPKYVVEAGLQWAMFDYGLAPAALVACDVDLVQHAALIANTDVFAYVENLDTNITGTDLSLMQTWLENRGIPADGFTTGNTVRSIIRSVAGLMQFAQRHHGLHNAPLLPSGVTLDTRWNQLTQTQRDQYTATAQSFGYDTSGITNNTRLRALFRSMADAWGTQPFYIGGVVI